MLLKFLHLFNYSVLLLLLATAVVPAFAVMYKWVDENGVTHYGDSIPPQYINRANVELNQGGVVLKKNEPALTPEQIKAKEAELAKRKQEGDTRRRDAVLLGTYTSAEEIDLARDRNLRQIEQIIKDTETQLKSVQDKLDASRKQAAAYKRDNQPVPDELKMDIEILEKSNQDLGLAVIQKRAEAKEVRVRFEEDKKRYIELTQGTSASSKPASAK